MPRLLEKVVASGKRAVVLAGSVERAAALSSLLWTYDPGSFLPHGTARDGSAAAQPIWLSDQDENPNAATMLVLVDGATSAQLAQFERCLDLFDGNDPDAVAAARRRWVEAKAAGHGLTYWQQTESGGWQAKD
ncbi:MAG: DNA polymerase III subunit chi [Alphaproteobacteria bacterium]